MKRTLKMLMIALMVVPTMLLLAACGEPTVTGITITTQPTKATYAFSEYFNPAGMKIKATLSNDKEETDIAVTLAMISGDALNANKTFKIGTPGTKTLTVTYEEKTATFTVTVNVAVVPDGEYAFAGVKFNGHVIDMTSLETFLASATEVSGLEANPTYYALIKSTYFVVSGNNTIIVNSDGVDSTYTFIVNPNGKLTVTVVGEASTSLAEKNNIDGQGVFYNIVEGTISLIVNEAPPEDSPLVSEAIFAIAAD